MKQWHLCYGLGSNMSKNTKARLVLIWTLASPRANCTTKSSVYCLLCQIPSVVIWTSYCSLACCILLVKYMHLHVAANTYCAISTVLPLAPRHLHRRCYLLFMQSYSVQAFLFQLTSCAAYVFLIMHHDKTDLLPRSIIMALYIIDRKIT